MRWGTLAFVAVALGAGCGQVPDHATDPTITEGSCWSCHGDLYLATTEPDHAHAALPHTCETCHDTVAWRPATLADHSPFWELTGAHTTAACVECHVDGRFAGTPRDCLGCHQAAFDASVNPPHVADTFPTSCDGCHETDAWRPGTVDDHGRFWVIEGAHVDKDCAACHDPDAWAAAPRDCVGCHQADYDGTTDPDHLASGYPTSCAVCHTAAAWRPANFRDHDLYWPLEGHHATTPCESCHAGDHYQGTPRECEGCHMANYEATTAPDHADENIATACAGCHTPESWSPASFTVHDDYWPLTGKHAETSCASCHVDSVYPGTTRTCDGCHGPDCDATTEPPHAAAELGHDCETCHTAAGWSPAELDHDVFWPLTGKHSEPGCTECHVDKVYEGTARVCEDCHLADYTTSEDPPHAADGYPTDCARCHVTADWAPSSFDHDAFYPLLGQHSVTECAACHAGGVFAGTANTCDGCHHQSYLDTADPVHADVGFSTDCAACHSPAGWDGANFDHDQFWPLTGAHTATQCASCHVGGTYAP